ncbi:MAG: hypothetical protein R2848_04340 [Thermomicrobiales bacterium]
MARIAAGFMGAAGGCLAGRSYQGLVVVLTSVAAAAFIVPALLRLRRKPTRRSAGIAQGIVIGLFILAGQGYLQVGFILDGAHLPDPHDRSVVSMASLSRSGSPSARGQVAHPGGVSLSVCAVLLPNSPNQPTQLS